MINYKFKRRRRILRLSAKFKLKLKVLSKPNFHFKRPYKVRVQNFIQKCFLKPKLDYSIKNLLPEQKTYDIVASKSENIYGFQVSKDILTMTLEEYLNYDGDLNLYIAQLPLFRRISKNDIENAKQIKDIDKKLRKLNKEQLAETDVICPIVDMEDITSINLWCSRGFTDSGWHYDSYDNFLGVSEGIKIVQLASKTDWRDWVGVYDQSYNHIKIHSSKLKYKYVTLKPNELLFIPQGMFHRYNYNIIYLQKRVISLFNSVALNFWMKGIEDSKVEVNEYHLRYQLNESAKKYCLEKLNKMAQNRLNQIKSQRIDKLRQQIESNSVLKKTAHRTVDRLQFDQEIIAILSLLYLEYNSETMALFLIKNMEIFLYLSDELSQLIVAYKLEDFTQKEQLEESYHQYKEHVAEKIQLREQFLDILWKSIDKYFLEKIQQTKQSWEKNNLIEMLMQHIK